MVYELRKYPLLSACGLNCGLCPRYHTKGTSKCPGCGGTGFSSKHPSCWVLSCCQRRELEYCYECANYPCEKYADVDQQDSFITHKNQLHDFVKVKSGGIDAYKEELNKKVQLLEEILKNYDNGRRKSFYCTAVNLLSLNDSEKIISQINKGSQATTEEVVQLFQDIGKKQAIDFKLRRKSKKTRK